VFPIVATFLVRLAAGPHFLNIDGSTSFSSSVYDEPSPGRVTSDSCRAVIAYSNLSYARSQTDSVTWFTTLTALVYGAMVEVEPVFVQLD
jgi:hypothetical protein